MPSSNSRLVYSTDPEPKPDHPARPPAATAKAAGQPEPVRVYLERKGRGGKSVSVIRGVQSHPDGKKDLLKLLQQKLGTGGAVKEGDIEIQGDHRDRIVAMLIELGYKAKKAGG